MTSRIHRTILLMALILVSVAAGSASAYEFTYCWSCSPMTDIDGHPLAPAVEYEVWLRTNSDPAVRIATVESDTAYVLSVSEEAEYSLCVYGVDALGRRSVPSEWSDPVTVERTTDVPDVTAAGLRPAYPNPFNPRTTLSYAIPADLAPGASVHLFVYDARGKQVRRFQIDRTPGWHEVQWNGRDDRGQSVATGVYMARFICGRTEQTTKMTLMK